MPTIEYIKDCKCKGPAATNRIVTAQHTDPKTFAIILTTTFYPMPTCCVCDKPWRRTEKP